MVLTLAFCQFRGESQAASIDADDLARYKQEVLAEDAKLNETYRETQSRFNAAGNSFLKSVQRAWIAFKDRDFPIFVRQAASADDIERLFRYQREEIRNQTEALKFLGSTSRRTWDEHQRTSAEQADQMLNGIYRICLQMLPSDQIVEFKETQALWIQFRDLHYQFDAALKGGRADGDSLRDITMRRVVNLRHYMFVLMDKRFPVDHAGRDLEAANEISEPNTEARIPDVFRFVR